VSAAQAQAAQAQAAQAAQAAVPWERRAGRLAEWLAGLRMPCSGHLPRLGRTKIGEGKLT